MRAADTSIAAWQMALKNRPLDGKLLFHRSGAPVRPGCTIRLHRVSGSIQGVARLAKHDGAAGAVERVSVGTMPWPRAFASAIRFKTLKCEMVNHVHFETRHQAKLATFEYIEGWYNRRRKHSTLDYQTSLQCESYFFTTSMAA